jgi:hypothetical protein
MVELMSDIYYDSRGVKGVWVTYITCHYYLATKIGNRTV